VTESGPPVQRPSLIRQFGLFIGWLSGATVGLAALFSGSGCVADNKKQVLNRAM